MHNRKFDDEVGGLQKTNKGFRWFFDDSKAQAKKKEKNFKRVDKRGDRFSEAQDA
jgi:hypothetical protein